MSARETLFFFSKLNALDNVPLSSIKMVIGTKETLEFSVLDEFGKTIPVKRKRTAYVEEQIKQYGIELFEV